MARSVRSEPPIRGGPWNGRGAGASPDAADLPGAGRDRGRQLPLGPAPLAAARAAGGGLRHLPAAGDRPPPPGRGRPAGRGAVAGLQQPGRPGAQPPPARLRPDLRHRPGPRPGRRPPPGAGLVAAGPAPGRLPRVRPAGPGPGRRHGGPGPRRRARPLEPHLAAGPALPGRRGGGPRAARPRPHPRQPPGARPGRRRLCRPGPPAPRLAPGAGRRPGRRRPAAGRLRQLRQLDRAPPALPAHGPPQRPAGRRPPLPVPPLPERGRRPGRRPLQSGALQRVRSPLGSRRGETAQCT